MVTRRQLLAAVASLPLLPKLPGFRFIEEPHLLAAESVRGYRPIARRGGWIIAPGIRNMTAQMCATLMKDVCSGARLLLESGLCFDSHEQAKRQLRILKQGLGLDIQPPVSAGSYINYAWPLQRMVRPFQAVTPVACDEHEVVARFDGLPVCLKRNIGRGCILYLGSMLGPGLLAEERESHAIGNALLLSRL